MVIELTREQLGQNFRMIREHHGFSREQIAEYLDKDPDEIHAFEDGRLIIGMGIADLERACDLFGITLMMLMEKETYRPITYKNVAEALDLMDMEDISRINRIALNLRKMRKIADENQKTISENTEEKNENGMAKMHVNIREVANLLVQMYYMTGQEYSCTQTKLEKLIAILAFKYAINNKLLFDEAIYQYKDCGVAISGFNKIFPDRDVYLHPKYGDGRISINEKFATAMFTSQGASVNKFKHTESLSEYPELRTEIEQVFRKFGAYSSYLLGQIINPIAEKEKLLGYRKMLNLEDLQKMSRNDFDGDKTLVKWLFIE